MNIEVRCAYPDELLYANVHATSRKCSRWLKQSDAHKGHAVIVGGGPSVADHLDTIKKRQALGQTVFALNGACRFLNDNGIIPDYQVFLDANKEMGDRVGIAEHYLVASQCAPELLDGLPEECVTLWHYALEDVEEHLPNHDGQFNLVGGMVSVGLTTMNLAYVMGFRAEHLFGYDSSNRDGKDHAYATPGTEERLGDMILNDVEVTYGGQKFRSTLSMTRQAEMFPIVCNNLIDLGVTITVEADGLIKAVMDEIRFANAEKAAA